MDEQLVLKGYILFNVNGMLGIFLCWNIYCNIWMVFLWVYYEENIESK